MSHPTAGSVTRSFIYTNEAPTSDLADESAALRERAAVEANPSVRGALARALGESSDAATDRAEADGR